MSLWSRIKGWFGGKKEPTKPKGPSRVGVPILRPPFKRPPSPTVPVDAPKRPVEPPQEPDLPETVLTPQVVCSKILARSSAQTKENVRTYWPLILEALEARDIGEPTMQLMALATVHVETGNFAPISEFVSKYNTDPGGEPFAKYDFRSDLGNKGKGDGARYRGRGFIQLTGRYNYRRYGKMIHMDLEGQPDLALRADVSAAVLVLYLWDHRKRLRKALRDGDLTAARKVVNGGTHGLERFEDTYRRGERLL